MEIKVITFVMVTIDHNHCEHIFDIMIIIKIMIIMFSHYHDDNHDHNDDDDDHYNDLRSQDSQQFHRRLAVQGLVLSCLRHSQADQDDQDDQTDDQTP